MEKEVKEQHRDAKRTRNRLHNPKLKLSRRKWDGFIGYMTGFKTNFKHF